MATGDLFTLLLVGSILIFIIVLFMIIALRLRKHGGSLQTTMHASMYEFLTSDKQKAVQEIVEGVARKKLVVDENEEPLLNSLGMVEKFPEKNE